ncbi:MAG TPA: spore coat protein U domain-containing protein [Ramlibacter sp.]|uniref:spore coat protein U domain-containing protein n=1 Tax=Ramlibacter sp. TaxID=1917967 RepID=UPI002ED0C192
MQFQDVTRAPARSAWTLCALAAAATFLAPAAQAETRGFAVGAVIVSKSNCKFNTPTLLLDFGTINPASTTTATASVSSSVTCNGGQGSTVTLAFTLGAGTFDSGPGARRMRHATTLTEFLPYSLGVTPASATIAKNGTLAFTVNGSILASQFQNVMAGNYTDRVAITVSP